MKTPLIFVALSICVFWFVRPRSFAREDSVVASNLVVISTYVEMTINHPDNPYVTVREYKWTNWVGRTPQYFRSRMDIKIVTP